MGGHIQQAREPILGLADVYHCGILFRRLQQLPRLRTFSAFASGCVRPNCICCFLHMAICSHIIVTVKWTSRWSRLLLRTFLVLPLGPLVPFELRLVEAPVKERRKESAQPRQCGNLNAGSNGETPVGEPFQCLALATSSAFHRPPFAVMAAVSIGFVWFSAISCPVSVSGG